MNTLLDPSESSASLNRYRGGSAQVWLFQVSHKRLILRLSLPDQQESLYIVAITCEHIVGPFSWRNASVSVVATEPELITRVIDESAGFELVCGGVALCLGPPDQAWEPWGEPDR
jgi:hypothetical protein